MELNKGRQTTMMYSYSEAKSQENNAYVLIRLKHEKRYYRCEYYDGMRLLTSSVPDGKHRYETRHSDFDISLPVAVAPEETPIIVNFCGTLISDLPLLISKEKQLAEILFPGDCREDMALAKIYAPQKSTNPE